MKNRLFSLILPFIAAAVMVGCSEPMAVAPADEAEVAYKKDRAAGQQMYNLAETVIAAAGNDTKVNDNGEFEVLLDVILTVDGALGEDAFLVDALSNPDVQFTVFAPTDEAFGNLFSTLAGLGVTPTVDQLVRVLLFHIAEGRQFSTPVVNKKQIATLGGQYIMKDKGATLKHALGEANIITQPDFFDIPASNGVVHAIDAVLIPQDVLDEILAAASAN